MFELFNMARTPIGELCWQLGVFLVVGLAASFALGHALLGRTGCSFWPCSLDWQLPR